MEAALYDLSSSFSLAFLCLLHSQLFSSYWERWWPQYLQNYITLSSHTQKERQSLPSPHINSSKSTQFDLAWIIYEFMDESLSIRMGALIGQFKDYILASMEKVGFLINSLTRVILNQKWQFPKRKRHKTD